MPDDDSRLLSSPAAPEAEVPLSADQEFCSAVHQALQHVVSRVDSHNTRITIIVTVHPPAHMRHLANLR
jgi:hypothetical protein